MLLNIIFIAFIAFIVCLWSLYVFGYLYLSAIADTKEYRRLIELQKGKVLRIPYALKDEEVNVYGNLNLSKKGAINGLDAIIGTIVYSMNNVASSDKSNCSETFTIIECIKNGRDVMKIRLPDGMEGYIYASKITRFAEVRSLGSRSVCAFSDMKVETIEKSEVNDLMSGLSFPVSVKSAIKN